jgi:hypothetical protein
MKKVICGLLLLVIFSSVLVVTKARSESKCEEGYKEVEGDPEAGVICIGEEQMPS